MLDLVIIGAGPAGIAAAYESKRAGLSYVVIEKGLIANTIYNYPVGLTVFSTTNELEFNEGDLKPALEKPTREELLSYYVRFVLDNELDIRTEENVLSVVSAFDQEGAAQNTEKRSSAKHTKKETEEEGSESPKLFLVTTDKREYETRCVLFAIGAMDHPRKLNVPGEDLPKVHDHFRETYPWVKKKAMIVGGGNSAGEAALFLAQEGAETTLAIFRDDWENNDPKQGCIKYWVKQPLEEELKENCLKLFFLGKVVEIRENEVELESDTGERAVIENDVVFALIGSDADLKLLKDLGVTTEQGKHGEVPVYDQETFETNVPGVFVAGHFTHHRHIKPAIDAAKTLVPRLAARLKGAEAKA
ncbi:MAG TPA: NAD(P)-binding domain-containing protein [Pyrinomonadaceae bacterium]|nr:NAD(P)-binding domain-containing protein [Pyrinomonadaceae bacterium]